MPVTDDDAIIVSDVGQHQMWVAQYYKFLKPNMLCTSGGLGTMGYGFPAAIGAQIANRDKLVVNVAGDGSIQMNIQELGTVGSYNIPVKNLILNNGYLGMVRQWQELFYDNRYSSVSLHSQETLKLANHTNPKQWEHREKYIPDFVKVAEAYNVKGIWITKPADLEAGLKEMINHKGPVMCEVLTAPEENVMPMVPAGAALHEMLLS